MKHDFNEDANFTEDMSFGEFLRKKRRLLGMNQSDFGYYIGAYHQHTISMWETGQFSPSFDEARRIVELLGGDLLIIGIKEDRKPPKSKFERSRFYEKMVLSQL